MRYYMFPVYLILIGCKPVPAVDTINSVPEITGKELFDYYGCKICHSLTGDKTLYGPPLNDILNTKIEVIRQGQPQIIKVDRDYLFRSVRDPGYEKVRDFQNKVMPESEIPDDKLSLIIDYVVLINMDYRHEPM